MERNPIGRRTLMAGAATFGLLPARLAWAAAPVNFPTEKINIEIWWHEYGPMSVYVKDLIQRYKSVRPNVTINPVVLSSGDINQKLTVGFATGTGPNILDQDASFYELYFLKGLLEPLNLGVYGAEGYDEIASHYTPGGLAAAMFQGKIYALPYQGNSMSMFLSNKAFAAAGLDPVKDAPKTWADMIALGPKLKKVQDRRTVQKAFDFPYHSARWEMQCFQPLVEQFGGKILSADGKSAFLNSPEAVKALTLWAEVTKAGGDPKTTLNTPSNPNQDFIDGRTAMWITGPWATSQIRDSQIKSDFTVVSLPQVDPAHPHTILYGWQWGVNKAKPDAEKVAAWDFIRFMMSKPEEWLDKVAFTQPVKGVNETDVAKHFPFFDVHMRDISNGSWYIRSEFTNEIGQAAGSAIERTIYDGVDPKKSLDQAQAEADRVMKK